MRQASRSPPCTAQTPHPPSAVLPVARPTNPLVPTAASRECVPSRRLMRPMSPPGVSTHDSPPVPRPAPQSASSLSAKAEI
eukprot:scaffold14916_cov128-Isochrysis_galbana.AAC.11